MGEFKQKYKVNRVIKNSEIIKVLADGSLYIKEGVKRLGYKYDETEESASHIIDMGIPSDIEGEEE